MRRTPECARAKVTRLHNHERSFALGRTRRPLQSQTKLLDDNRITPLQRVRKLCWTTRRLFKQLGQEDAHSIGLEVRAPRLRGRDPESRANDDERHHDQPHRAPSRDQAARLIRHFTHRPRVAA